VEHRELQSCESVVDEAEELQLRQVHPEFVKDDGRLRPQAFRGTSDDRLAVSTVRGSQVSAEDACSRHLALGRKSAGTWGVNGTEVASVGGRVLDDANCDGNEVPHHSTIDLSHLGNESNTAALGKMGILSSAAAARGCLAPAES
jgi:hypothetical protein